MSRQDIVIAIANVCFSIGLIIQVYYGFREKSGPIKYATSVPTFLGLYAISFAFWSLGLYASTFVSLITGTLWLVLFIQRLIYKKKVSHRK